MNVFLILICTRLQQRLGVSELFKAKNDFAELLNLG